MRIDNSGNIVRDLEASEDSLVLEDRENPFPRLSRCGCGLSKWWWLMVAVFVASSVLCFVTDSTIFLIILIFDGWLMSLTLHEFCHAIVAYKGGDSSVKDAGYLTLDVTRYLDPIMTFLVPCLILIFGGIPLPGGAVRIMTGRLNSRSWMTYVSIAGPIGNLVFGIVVAGMTLLWNSGLAFFSSDGFGGHQSGPMGPMSTMFIGGEHGLLSQALAALAFLQIIAFLLNMIPLPPLDGWGAISPWLPANCFLKRWMGSEYLSMATTAVCLLIIFVIISRTPFFSFVAMQMAFVFRLDVNDIQGGMSKFRSISPLRF